ncbi:M28 family metallopeptidase [Sediminibacterium ginsengisoli]|uniref:Carboxypeptidase Q n=1 Tax=Sediminibacterium ginsengisoli TaxID=413434 RepID=A0A1T4QVZ2_9BACT|nr:M20/M25/M40 family metallo-hydrolase [Sediminibacterium ginsengisoli]SKA07922.1 Peptidase family M28 [Sediminibacterium ginsengisoli]
MRKLSRYTTIMALSLPFAALAQEKIDAAMMQKIRKEGLENSKVMEIAFNLTDKSGNRLMNSPGYFRAANYAKDALTSWGVSGAKLDPFGEFGKGWELEKSYVAITAPYYKPLLAFPKAWCGGTKGQKSAEVIVISAKDTVALEAYKGKLKGKIIILDQPTDYKHSFKPDAFRYTDEELAKMAAEQPQAPRQAANPADTAAMRRMREQMAARGGGGAARVGALLKEMAKNEGAIALLSSGGVRSHDGTIFAQGGGAYKGTDPENFLDLALGLEDFNTILRLAKSGTPVKMDVDVKTKFYDKDLQGYNVIAEIPGTDPALKDEVVMIGGHLDSWQTGTGATDNASGSAVMMEAMRILKTLGIQPKRTIRIGLWGGEEQGLHGSRGYVKNTFGDISTMQTTPAHAKFSSYFNIDNGTGKIRGIYLQGNAQAKGIFTEWLAPFKDLGATTVTIANTGGTDHQSFDAIGLPGFQFIQDPIEYNQRTHHSNMDVYDHLIEEDLKQIATIVAAFAYNAAQREAKIPRKEMPKPRPAGGRNF